MMQLFVRTDRSHLLEVGPQATVADVKAMAEAHGIACERLVFGGKQLEDDSMLSLCGVEEAATLYALGRLLGGGKKRKKKTYTKPKKIKHKHKNEKLRILRYYKVDDSGNVQRNKKVCPEPMCGPGVFMATHTSKGGVPRCHCGKCGVTYLYEK